MEIIDFLPKYPNIENTKNAILNPYSGNFYNSIFSKKEFYDLKLTDNEFFPKEKGGLTKYQKTIARYLSSRTPYDSLLLVHSMGLGKTCAAIGVVEQIKSEESSFTGALVLAKGKGILNNFLNELVFKCTEGQYIPSDYKNLSELTKIQRMKKKTNFYELKTFAKFAKTLQKLTNNYIEQNYSNKIIIIDEVHNIRPQDNKIQSFETYKQVHRFLHLVKNCKILLLSGTPMKDSPDEIATVMNLILPLEKQLPTGLEFLKEYMTEEKKDVFIMKKEKITDFKNIIRGKISFLREPESTVEKKFMGIKNYKGLNYFTVNPVKMSDFQSEVYESAVEIDQSGQKGIYNESRQATLFVYPNKKYGSKGFEEYITSKKSDLLQKSKKTSAKNYRFKNDILANELKGVNDRETLNNISKYSATYATVIEKILNTKGNCFIYCSITQGSGAILFSLLLELFGFSRANGTEKTKGVRYALLTSLTSSEKNLKDITKRFNEIDNVHGDYIKVIIGSKAVSEGFSFKNVIFEAILTPHWNYSETQQALARGIRLGSHNDLIKEGIVPEVEIMQIVSISKKGKSIDLYNYKISEDKDVAIRSILRVLMENAFDCALNYLQNHAKNQKDGSRECDYMNCDFKCDGIDSYELDTDNVDLITYQIYYTDPKISNIKSKIGKIFRKNEKIDYNSVKNILLNNFSEEEIENALYFLKEESKGAILDKKIFDKLYSKTPVQKIIDKLEELFRFNFKLTFSDIKRFTKEYTDFELLTALNTVISENIILTDRYGFSCYLREDMDIFFLVNNLSVKPDIYTEYYTRYPHINVFTDFKDIKQAIYNKSLFTIVKNICIADNEKELVVLLKTLPEPIQQIFIESSIIAKEKKISKAIELRNTILEYYKSYINKVDDFTIVDFLGSRCLVNGKWSDCDENYKNRLKEKQEEKNSEKRKNNPYGIIGKYNPENEAFCIVDFAKEAEKKNLKTKEDGRVKYSGKVCSAGGWKIKDLVSIMAQRLKIDPPEDFREDEDEKELYSAVKNDNFLKEFLSGNKKEDKESLRRLLYWGKTKSEGGRKGIKSICESLKDWFEQKELLEVDNLCGVQGKKQEKETKTKEKTTKEKGLKIKIAKFDLSKTDFENFKKQYVPSIVKLMKDCFNLKKYVFDENSNHVWLLVFKGKKIIGCLSIDPSGKIWNVCVCKSQREKGVGKQLIREAISYVCSLIKETPQLLVDNKGENKERLINMYISFGFEIVLTDEKYTYLVYPKCNLK